MLEENHSHSSVHLLWLLLCWVVMADSITGMCNILTLYRIYLWSCLSLCLNLTMGNLFKFKLRFYSLIVSFIQPREIWNITCIQKSECIVITQTYEFLLVTHKQCLAKKYYIHRSGTQPLCWLLFFLPLPCWGVDPGPSKHQTNALPLSYISCPIIPCHNNLIL